MSDPNCLFCKIVAGDIPSTRVYEDERTIAGVTSGWNWTARCRQWQNA